MLQKRPLWNICHCSILKQLFNQNCSTDSNSLSALGDLSACSGIGQVEEKLPSRKEARTMGYAGLSI